MTSSKTCAHGWSARTPTSPRSQRSERYIVERRKERLLATPSCTTWVDARSLVKGQTEFSNATTGVSLSGARNDCKSKHNEQTNKYAARKGKLTASRIACLMTGNAAAIMQLYLEMIGEGEPEDLSAVWPVRLGEATEALNLEWFERRNTILSRHGEVVVHPRFLGPPRRSTHGAMISLPD